jgi:hypothetical protein
MQRATFLFPNAVQRSPFALTEIFLKVKSVRGCRQCHRIPATTVTQEEPQQPNRCGSFRAMLRKFTTVQEIREALVTSGYVSLDQQAKALGIHRSTAWTIIKSQHKLGRLNHKTIKRILENSETPPTVRTIVQQYLTEKMTTNARPHRKLSR